MPRLPPRRTVFCAAAVAATIVSLIANRATPPPHTMEAVRTALTQLDPAGADREKLAAWGEPVRYAAVAASDRDYETVRMYKGNLELPTSNRE